MRKTIFKVSVNYESSNYIIKADEHQFSRFNYVGNTLSQIVTKQFQISRDLAKMGIKALFDYNN